MTVKHFGKTLVGLLTLVVLLSLFCFNPTGVNAAKSTYRFESELVRVSSETNSFVQDDISSMDSLIVSSKTSQNQTMQLVDGIVRFKFVYEIGEIQYEVILKNVTDIAAPSETILFRMIHSDYYNGTNTANNTSVVSVINLGETLVGTINETKKALNILDLFNNKYEMQLLVLDLNSPNDLYDDEFANGIVKSSGPVINICSASSPVISYDLKNWKMWIVLLAVVAMLTSLILDLFRPYFVVLATLIFFTVLEVISIDEALNGFSNEGMITIAFLFPIVQPLSHNPALLKLSKIMFGKKRFLPITILRIVVPISILSMFLNNTPIVVMFIPLIKEWCKENDVAPSKLLIPLSYATIAGGLCTIIGTSTNLVASGLLDSYGYQSFSFFELIYIGGILLVIMWIYLCTVAAWALPSHKSAMLKDSRDKGEKFLTQLAINDKKSPLIGRSKKGIMSNLGLKSLEMVKVIRATENADTEVANNTTVVSVEHITPVPDTFRMMFGDKIVFKGLPEDIMNLHSITGIERKVKTSDIFQTEVSDNTLSNTSSKSSFFSGFFKKKGEIEEERSSPLITANEQKTYNSVDENELKMNNTNDEEVMSFESQLDDSQTKTAIPKHIDMNFEYFEVVISNNNSILGSDYSAFEKHFQGIVLALRHRDSLIGTATETEDFQSHTVSVGDTLLIISNNDFYEKWNDSREFFLISQSTVDPKQDVRKFILKFRGKEYNLWWWEYTILPIFIAMITAATIGYPMIKCTMLAFSVMVLFRLISPTKAISTIDWQLLILVASSFGVGVAIRNSGFAEAFADFVVWMQIPKQILPGIMFIITQICSAVITNNAAVSINLPLALAIAEASGLNARLFGIIVTIAASSDFSTPIGYTTNLLIQGPANYRFFDYTKVGLPLNIIFWLVTSSLAPLIWGLEKPNF